MTYSKWQDYQLSQIKNAENFVISEGFFDNTHGIHTEDTVRDLIISNAKIKPLECEFSSFMNMILEHEKTSFVCNVQGITDKLMELHKHHTIKGLALNELFRQDKCCIIRENGRLYKGGIDVGDEIKLNGINFHVIGIEKFPMSYGDVFLTYKDFIELCGTQKHQFQILLKYEEPFKITDIRPYLEKAMERQTECYTYKEHQERFLQSIFHRERERVVVIIILLILSCINFYIMMREHMIFSQKQIGIRMSVGASFHMIMLEHVIKILIINNIAILFSYMLYIIIAQIPMLGLNQDPSMKLFFILIILYNVIGIHFERNMLRNLWKRKSGLLLLKDVL